MSLEMSPLYLSCVRQFSSATGDSRFKSDFIDAANSAFDQLSDYAKLTDAIDHIENTDATVTDLDAHHSVIVLAGLVYFLILGGRKHIRGDDAYLVMKQEWEDAKGTFMQLMSEEDQSSQDDDGIPDTDIVGLGYLEDN